MQQLVSRFNINENVNIVLDEYIINAKVIKIHFSESKVFYDLHYIDKEGYSFRFYNVESNYVNPKPALNKI